MCTFPGPQVREQLPRVETRLTLRTAPILPSLGLLQDPFLFFSFFLLICSLYFFKLLILYWTIKKAEH